MQRLSLCLSVSVFRRSVSDSKQHRLNIDNAVHLILGLDSSDVSDCDQSDDDVSDTFIHSLVFSLRGRAGRNQSPVM